MNDPKHSPAWEEANAWVLRMHSGHLSIEERQEFETWQAQNAMNKIQFLKAQNFWNALDGISDHIERKQPLEVARSKMPALVTRQWLAVAAAIAFVVMVPSVWSITDLWLSDYRTAPGEQASVVLDDQSIIHLNTHSALSAHLSDTSRLLSLKQGEALFEVAADSARPFDVTVNRWVVRAVGTVFNINRRPDGSTVTVIEGAVHLMYDNQEWNIPAGYQLTHSTDRIIGALTRADLPQATEWRSGEFTFNNMPLIDVVEELNRYRSGAIVIANPWLRSVRLSGSVPVKDPERSLHMLQLVHPFRSFQVTSYLTIIS